MTDQLPPLSEAQFQAQVVELANITGWVTYHTHDSRHFGLLVETSIHGQRRNFVFVLLV